jgi:hypothetical protein
MPSLAALASSLGIGYALIALFVITIDRFRKSSPSHDDGHAELKILLYGLALSALVLGASGVERLLAFMLGGFKGGGDAIKPTLAPIAVGVGSFALILKLLVPRTNAATSRAAEALALLVAGLYYGATGIAAAYGAIDALVMNSPWEKTSLGLAELAVKGGVALVAIIRLGRIAGWTAPVRPQAQVPPQGYPPQGYPPQGYPPQGYPPQGGGYPPQGGGYPPQGGGYPR